MEIPSQALPALEENGRYCYYRSISISLSIGLCNCTLGFLSNIVRVPGAAWSLKESLVVNPPPFLSEQERTHPSYLSLTFIGKSHSSFFIYNRAISNGARAPDSPYLALEKTDTVTPSQLMNNNNILRTRCQNDTGHVDERYE